VSLAVSPGVIDPAPGIPQKQTVTASSLGPLLSFGYRWSRRVRGYIEVRKCWFVLHRLRLLRRVVRLGGKKSRTPIPNGLASFSNIVTVGLIRSFSIRTMVT